MKSLVRTARLQGPDSNLTNTKSECYRCTNLFSDLAEGLVKPQVKGCNLELERKRLPRIIMALYSGSVILVLVNH
jgi:hypothetical protein